MVNLIKCPHCHEEFELSEVYTHELEEQAQAKLEQTTTKKVREQFELRLKAIQDESGEEKDRSKKLSEQVSELMKELRQARRDKEDATLAMQKKLAEEEGKIRQEAQKHAEEAHDLKSREQDKVISDLKHALADATRKAEQGSQQTQGEVLELEIQELLTREFPTDQISEVKKGTRGADVTQVVIDKRGRNCGTILWESKNAQWQPSWIPKLKGDAREAKAHLSVLVATNPPEGVTSFSYLDGVWVVTRPLVTTLALALRYNLVSLHAERLNNVGKDEKKDYLFNYVTSHEFRSRIEAINDAFSDMQQEVEREKRWFQTKWSRQEKQLRAVFDNTYGVYADMQGVVGKSMPQLPSLTSEES